MAILLNFIVFYKLSDRIIIRKGYWAMKKRLTVLTGFLHFTAYLSVFLSLIIIASSFLIYNLAIMRPTEIIDNNQEKISPVFKISAEDSPIIADTLEEEFGNLFSDVDAYSSNVFSSGKWLESRFYETWSVTSNDGLKLIAYYIPAARETDKTAIIFHGYLGKGMDMDSFARFYSEKLGFNVLLPDARGHGASEGDYIGFGWHERHDNLLWIQKVIERNGDQAQIVLHGLSMGGAAVMMVSGESLPPQVKAIVEDCGYSSVYDEFSYLFKSRFFISGFPFIAATSMLTQLKAGFSFYEASALKQLAKNKTPALFIHGLEDTVVPASMVWQLYNSCRAEKEIYLVEGAGHGMAYAIDPLRYENVVTNFLSRFVEFDYPAI